MSVVEKKQEKMQMEEKTPDPKSGLTKEKREARKALKVRVLRVEIKQVGRSDDENKKLRAEILGLCKQVQEATNFCWMRWTLWHFSNGSPELVKQFQDDQVAFRRRETERKVEFEAAKKEKREPDAAFLDSHPEIAKPKIELTAISAELRKDLYAQLTNRWPELHTRVVVLLLNRFNELVMAKKSANSSFPGWQSILLFKEQIPSTTHPLPLPFDTPKTAESSNGNAKLLLPEGPKDFHTLYVKLGRIEVEGRKTKPSVEYRCQIWDKGRKMVGRRAILSKIAMGEYQMAGSSLGFKDGKMYANIAYYSPENKSIDGSRRAVLVPGRRHPLLLKIIGDTRSSRWIGGDGRVVGEVRRRLMSQRMSRKRTYNQAPTANSKGHGLNRSLDKVTKLSLAWRNFVTTFNRNAAAAVVLHCQTSGIGEVIIGKLHQRKKDSRFLSKAGQSSAFDSSSWEWYQMMKLIKDALHDRKIVVTDRN